MSCAIDQLTEKEKETLRLIVRGHDAKSSANELGLSVHTINERLRAARRKLDVTSSREAARLLFEAEGQESAGAPENLGYKPLGDADREPLPDNPPITNPGRNIALWIGGIVMTFTLAAVAAFTLMGTNAEEAAQVDAPSESVANSDAERESAARQWLALVDAQNWEASYAAAGKIFREPNTVATWKAASETARIPLGAVMSRKAIAFQDVASPQGYQVVQFRTEFEARNGVIESVTLQREDGQLRVVGYYIQ